jgi:hypothetical protein
MPENTRSTVVLGSVIIGVALILALGLHGWELASRDSGNSISVVGSSKRAVTADLAKWSATITRQATAYNLKAVLEQAATDVTKIKAFATAEGIAAETVRISPASTNPVYEQNDKYGQSQTVSGYTVSQEVAIESKDIQKIDSLARDQGKLIDQGIVTQYQRTEYFYSKLADLRPELFAEATKDAKLRALAVVQGTGAKVGSLKSAKTGVVQVSSPSSLDVSDYGNYDTSTKEKEVSATVNVSFELLK